MADRLHAVVQGNQHNTAQEPLWGNAGTLLAAIRMAESGAGDRWDHLVSQALDALFQDMVIDPEIGTWVWHQDLYGTRCRYLGAGHGLAGNAYAFLRGASHVDASLLRSLGQRILETLSATAMHADRDASDGKAELVNWPVVVDRPACPALRRGTTCCAAPAN